MKFKLGDRVIHKERGLGTVVMYDPNDGMWGIEIPNCERGHKTDRIAGFSGYENVEYLHNRIRSTWCTDDTLEHARIANTKITRKLYPHYEVDGEWLLIKEQR